MVVETIVTPRPRQVLVIAERERRIGFCLACRVRSPEGRTTRLVRGVADGTLLSDAQFRDSVEEADALWRQRYPEAEIVYLNCPLGLDPYQMASLEAERRVANGC